MVRRFLCSRLAAVALFAGQAAAFLQSPGVGCFFLPTRSICVGAQRVELSAAAGPAGSEALVGGVGSAWGSANSQVLLGRMLAGRRRHAGVCAAQLGETAFRFDDSASFEEVRSQAAPGRKTLSWHCFVCVCTQQGEDHALSCQQHPGNTEVWIERKLAKTRKLSREMFPGGRGNLRL